MHLSARKSRSAELVWLLQADELVSLALNHSSPSPATPPAEPATESAED